MTDPIYKSRLFVEIRACVPLYMYIYNVYAGD